MCHVLTNRIYVKFYFFNCYLTAPRSTLGHFFGENLTHPMLITAFLHFRAEGHREPRNEFGSLSQAELLVVFEPGTFRFLLQRLNPLGHSPRKCMSHTQNVKFYKLPHLIIFITSTFTNTTLQFPKYQNNLKKLNVHIFNNNLCVRFLKQGMYIYMFLISYFLFSIYV